MILSSIRTRIRGLFEHSDPRLTRSGKTRSHKTMKHVIRGLFAGPILALAAVLCVAQANASPAPSTAKIEKVMLDNSHYGTAAPNAGSPAAIAVFNDVMKTDGAMLATEANADMIGETPAVTVTSSTSFVEEGGAAPCGEKLAGTNSSYTINSTGASTSNHSTAAPSNSAAIVGTSSANNTARAYCTLYATASPTADDNGSVPSNRQLLAAAQNAAAPELVANTS